MTACAVKRKCLMVGRPRRARTLGAAATKDETTLKSRMETSSDVNSPVGGIATR